MLTEETQEVKEGKKKPTHAYTENPKDFTTRLGNEERVQKQVSSH